MIADVAGLQVRWTQSFEQHVNAEIDEIYVWQNSLRG